MNDINNRCKRCGQGEAVNTDDLCQSCMVDEIDEEIKCPKYNEKVLPDEKGNCSLCGKHTADDKCTECSAPYIPAGASDIRCGNCGEHQNVIS
jgi:hypothetical protein